MTKIKAFEYAEVGSKGKIIKNRFEVFYLNKFSSSLILSDEACQAEKVHANILYIVRSQLNF